MTSITVFTAQPIDGDYGRAMLIEDQRSGDVWEEPISGWEYIIEVDNSAHPDVSETSKARSIAYPCQSYYRHNDGRIATAAR
jgi:hypothetical protein